MAGCERVNDLNSIDLYCYGAAAKWGRAKGDGRLHTRVKIQVALGILNSMPRYWPNAAWLGGFV